uniref:Uncharacterized protein n=1 Tax=Arion vulgaris TaxID=1028688 RepID=A0A0B7AN86_9EUPU
MSTHKMELWYQEQLQKNEYQRRKSIEQGVQKILTSPPNISLRYSEGKEEEL